MGDDDPNGDRTAAYTGAGASKGYRTGMTRHVRFTLHRDDFVSWPEITRDYPTWTPEQIRRLERAAKCFMKQSNDPDCVYGRLYRERKQYEIKRNEAGGNARARENVQGGPRRDKGGQRQIEGRQASGLQRRCAGAAMRLKSFYRISML
jgi:hypothetical protein